MYHEDETENYMCSYSHKGSISCYVKTPSGLKLCRDWGLSRQAGRLDTGVSQAVTEV